MQIRTAYSGASDAHEHFAGPGGRPRPLDYGELARPDAKQGPQSGSSSKSMFKLFVMDKKRNWFRRSSCFFGACVIGKKHECRATRGAPADKKQGPPAARLPVIPVKAS